MATVLDKANDAAPTVDDILYVINDPIGVPGDRKVTGGNLAQAMAGWAPFTGFYAPKADPVGTGVATWPRLAASGVTGAALQTRLVGSTATGAPAAGTHQVGDIVEDRTGQLWLCTNAAGSGTWVAPGSGRELGYAEITAGSAVAGLGLAARADVAGLSITFTPADRPIMIEVWARYFNGVGFAGAKATTVAAGSNGVNTNTFVGAQVLNVAATAGFDATGLILVVTGTTPALIRYGAIGSATTFTGCATLVGGGVMATGGAVNDGFVGGLGLTISTSAGVVVADAHANLVVANLNSVPGLPKKRYAAGVLPAGVPVTYKAQAFNVFGGTTNIGAAASSPAFIRAWEV